MQEYYLNSEKKICLMELSEFKELEAQLMTVYGLALLNLPVIQLLKWIRTRKK